MWRGSDKSRPRVTSLSGRIRILVGFPPTSSAIMVSIMRAINRKPLRCRAIVQSRTLASVCEVCLSRPHAVVYDRALSHPHGQRSTTTRAVRLATMCYPYKTQMAGPRSCKQCLKRSTRWDAERRAAPRGKMNHNNHGAGLSCLHRVTHPRSPRFVLMQARWMPMHDLVSSPIRNITSGSEVPASVQGSAYGTINTQTRSVAMRVFFKASSLPNTPRTT